MHGIADHTTDNATPPRAPAPHRIVQPPTPDDRAVDTVRTLTMAHCELLPDLTPADAEYIAEAVAQAMEGALQRCREVYQPAERAEALAASVEEVGF